MSNAKTIGVISIKGGVGKTTTVVNLATSLANDYQKKVLIVDANFSSPNVGLHLGNVNHNCTIHEVIKGKADAKQAIHSHEYGFHYIPASLTHTNSLNYNHLKQKLSSLKKHYDYLILDSSPSLNDELAATINAADDLYVVSSPDLPTLSTTLRAVRLAKEKGMQIRGIVLNKVRGKNYELTPADMTRLTGIPVVSTIKDNVKVLEALSHVKPITLHSPYSSVALEYKKLAALVANEKYIRPSLLKRVLGYLVDDFNNFRHHDFKKGMKYY